MANTDETEPRGTCPRDDCNGNFHTVNHRGAGWCEDCGSLFTSKEAKGPTRVLDILEAFRARTNATAEADYDDYSAVLQWVWDDIQNWYDTPQLFVVPGLDETWVAEVRAELERWTKEPNYSPIVPLPQIQEPHVERMLVFSTAHISEKVAGQLEAGALYARMTPGEVVTTEAVETRFGVVRRRDVLNVAFMRPNGFLIHVDEDRENWAKDLPATLWSIYDKTNAQGCCWAMLDSDGPVHSGLPTWSW